MAQQSHFRYVVQDFFRDDMRRGSASPVLTLFGLGAPSDLSPQTADKLTLSGPR